jgi:hypothetical protein
MSGHFEKGAWVEDPPVPEPEQEYELNVTVTVHVDDKELKDLQKTLEGIQHFVSLPVSFWGRLRWLLFGGIDGL